MYIASFIAEMFLQELWMLIPIHQVYTSGAHIAENPRKSFSCF